jgi:hypothetical protein
MVGTSPKKPVKDRRMARSSEIFSITRMFHSASLITNIKSPQGCFAVITQGGVFRPCDAAPLQGKLPFGVFRGARF